MSSQLESEAGFEATPLGFIYRQWTRRKPLPAGINLSSQTAIITGSNVGLGLESGRQLLQLGLSRLVLAVRSQEKGDAAAQGLRKGFPNAEILVWLLEMNSYKSITAFAKKCKTSLSRIDIVILNVGLMAGNQFKASEETAREYSVQVNYISTALLTILLLPILKSSARLTTTKPPVLTIVASDAALWGRIKTQGPVLAQLDRREKYNPMHWYQKSKLLQFLFVSKLAEEVSASDVVINLVNPGLCSGTAFGQNGGPELGAVASALFKLMELLMARTTADGASIYVDAAVARAEESHGSYVSDWAIKP